jgi:hypothetical protein
MGTPKRSASGRAYRKKRRQISGLMVGLLALAGILLFGLVAVVVVFAFRGHGTRTQVPRERLVGVWEADFGPNGHSSLDFRSTGELFVVNIVPRGNPPREDQTGTWEILKEHGGQCTIRLRTLSSTGKTYDNTKDFTFQGPDSFTVSGRTETWHRRRS